MSALKENYLARVVSNEIQKENYLKLMFQNKMMGFFKGEGFFLKGKNDSLDCTVT